MNRLENEPQRRRQGYSLVEMLVVVAIIGLISLVTIPNFIVFARQGKLKSSLRNLTNDVRWTRQLAITQNCRTKISFKTGGAPGEAESRYTIFQELTHPTTGARSWSEVRTRQLDSTVYFSGTNFPDDTSPNDPDTLNDVIFLANGTIGNIPVAGGLLRIETDQQIPEPIYTITFNVTGQFTTAAS